MNRIIFYFPLKLCPLILVFISRSGPQHSVIPFSSGDFLIPPFPLARLLAGLIPLI